jgi:glycerol kinase
MSTPRFIASIDQGTTSTRCCLFDRTSKLVAMSQREHRQIFPQPGWVEHDPIEIWQRTQEVVAEAIQRAGAKRGDMGAVGIANQRETTVVWDRRTGLPLCNAIVWQDTRTRELCDQLDAEAGAEIRRITGLPPATYFSGPKLAWILQNERGVNAAAKRGDAIFGTIDTWLTWNLTGVHVTDVTNASRTLLMNIDSRQWDDAMLARLDIPRAMLPTITSSSSREAFGKTSPTGCFGDAIPVCGNLGDQQAALVGQACFNPGESKNTYGTGCFVLLNTGTSPVRSNCGLLTTVAYQFDDQPAVYALEGSIAVTGSLVQWLRDNIGIIQSASQIEELARSVPDSGGVFIVPAFSGLFAPRWRSDARGVIVGLTRHANRGHIARAALEATAFQTRDVIDAMRADSGVDLTMLKVDGGMTANDLLMQTQADYLGVPVVRPKVTETTALGAAYAAGLAIGFWNGLDDLRANWQTDKIWKPAMSQATRDELHKTWLKAVERTLDWVE